MFPNFDEVMGFAGNSYVQVLHTEADHWIAINVVSDKTSMTVFIHQN